MRNLTKKILILPVVCLVCACVLCAETITLGGKQGWSRLAKQDGVTEGKGRYGWKCMQLATNSRLRDTETDILLGFESVPFYDAAGNYTVRSNSLGKTTHAVMGNGAGISRNTGNGLVLSGNPGTLFGTEGPVGSFFIEFWLCPSVAENGEVIFNWRSSRNAAGSILYQTISAVFSGNRLEWTFFNVFDGYSRNEGEVHAKGTQPLIPGKWSHHVVSFDEEDGSLEYRIDGQLESVQFITASGHELSTVYPINLGVPADIEICPEYTGSIDDFRICRGSYKNGDAESAADLHYSVYKTSGGRIESEPLLTKDGSILNSVDVVMNEPAQTSVCLYVRSGDNYFGWTDTEPAWKPVKSGQPISGVTGLYFQIAADLYPDGAGKITPSITQIVLNYTELPLPLPPFTVRAEGGDSQVTITWSYSVDDSAGGYYVYYGTRPGEYLGRAAKEGPSPVYAGNTTSFTLTGLQNGRIYYFAVSTRSRLDSRINGQLSKEVFARPEMQ